MQTSLSLAAAVKKLQLKWASGSSVFPVLWSHVTMWANFLSVKKGSREVPEELRWIFPPSHQVLLLVQAWEYPGAWVRVNQGLPAALLVRCSPSVPLAAVLLWHQCVLCSLWGPAAHFGALPQNSRVTLESEVWEEDTCPNPVSKSSRVLVLAWKGCVGQTVLASCFVPFFCSRIWGFYCAQGHLYSSLVIQGGGEGSVYFHTARDPWLTWWGTAKG